MKLTPEQIDRLYQFTIQHYVEYYDLQTELVDHLANAIEQQWQENPKISFEDALQIEFNKFGIFGFTDVVGERQLALGKKYRQIVWQHLKTFFTIPKIFATLIFIGIVFNFLKFFNSVEGVIQCIFAVLFLSFFVGSIIRSRKKKKQCKLTGKKWLFDQILSGSSYALIFSNLLLQMALNFSGANYQDWQLWFAGFSIVLIAIIGYIVLFLIPSKAEEYLKQTYPEYEIANSKTV